MVRSLSNACRKPAEWNPANEIAKLREEATAFRSVRSALLSPDIGDEAATITFDKVSLFTSSAAWPT